MSFQETPGGWVVLWRISDRKFSAKIVSVYGYDIATGTWQVGAQYSDVLGQGTLTVSIERESGTGDWVLAHTKHQRPAHNESAALIQREANDG